MRKKKSTKLDIVLCWHMHQPEYRDRLNNEYQLPWTYLHAIKDYTDMAAHIEENPKARAVVNFTPTLLEQLDDYSSRLEQFLGSKNNKDCSCINDPLLAALASSEIPKQAKTRFKLISQCLKASKERLIDRFSGYQHLAEMAQWAIKKQSMLCYLNDQFIYDLLVWYHLAWIGETIKRNNSEIKALIEKQRNFNQSDRLVLLEIIRNLISGIIPRYKVLAEKGQIELSVTPYAHPIMPLMLDLKSTRDALPNAPLPEHKAYPGGEERLHWHITHGLEVFEKHFGFIPSGCWPSEGSVSDQSLELLAQHNFNWVASGANVLHNSINRANLDEQIYDHKGIHRVYRIKDIPISHFFRDDGLADMIGFQYSKWHADDAVANFIENLENIYQQREDHKNRVVSIILDGENAWEYYPENGYYFLNALYAKLAEHPYLNLTTFSDVLAHHPEPVELPGLVAGSWVYGTFSTWIGEKSKNRGWDMLIDAKICVDKVLAQQNLKPKKIAKIEQQLAICEGSDWFWWFGDYNTADSVSSFEKLFRLNLSILYQMLEQSEPEYLSKSFTFGGGAPAAGGAMRTGKE
ncbi:MAG: glycoside hydrolase family 57 protein [Pseudomonadota bacterium]